MSTAPPAVAGPGAGPPVATCSSAAEGCASAGAARVVERPAGRSPLRSPPLPLPLPPGGFGRLRSRAWKTSFENSSQIVCMRSSNIEKPSFL